MSDPSLDWLDLLPDLRVAGVRGVHPQKSTTFLATFEKSQGVRGVAHEEGDTLRHLTRHPESQPKSLIIGDATPATPRTPEFEHVAGLLPPDVVAGVHRLRTEPGPHISNPALWGGIVDDAVRLAADHWAMKAITLGWHPHELFGASPAAGGEPYLDGLAVWLRSRRLLLIDKRCAIVVDGTERAVFSRFDPTGARYLWDLADIQRERNEKPDMRAGEADEAGQAPGRRRCR